MLTPAQLAALSDEELEQQRLDVVQEQVRRAEKNNLPVDIDALMQRFVNIGGDISKIKNPSSYTRNV